MTEKEKIRAEIKRLCEENKERHSIEGIAAVTELRKLLSFIDSMQEESASEDLEKEIDRVFIKNECSSQRLYHKEIADIARHFAAWQREQMMKNVVDGKVYESVDQDSVWVVQDGWLSSKERGLVAGDRVKLIIVKEG